MRPGPAPAPSPDLSPRAVPPRRLALLVNPTAGGGRVAGRLAGVEARLAERGLGFRTLRTRSAEHVAVATGEALDRGETPVAVGGDGMAALVAGAVADRPGATFGLVPAGRGNDVARFLGLPVRPDAAADVLVDGIAVAVDCGAIVRPGCDVPSGPLLSVASCGFAAEANRRANASPPRLGALAYVWGGLAAVASLRPTTYRLTLDGDTTSHRALLVAVANTGAFGGGMRVAPRASVADGRFDVVVVEHRGRAENRCDLRDRLRLVRGLPRVFGGTHIGRPGVRLLRGAEVRIEADRPEVAYADGDVLGPLPVTLRTRPGALRLLVPRGHRSPALDPDPSPPGP